MNEQTAVVNFLEDCVQLCLKTPYHYIEELCVPSSEISTAKGFQLGGNTPSPLLATVMEQIPSRIAAGLCSSDTLSIVSFARRLLVRLSGKMENLVLLSHLSQRLVSLIASEIMEEDRTIIAKTVAQEFTILRNYLGLLCNPDAHIPVPESPFPAVTDFLDRIERTSPRTTLLSPCLLC
jgi:nucleolar pre-ribosomal-associated protein 1